MDYFILFYFLLDGYFYNTIVPLPVRVVLQKDIISVTLPWPNSPGIYQTVRKLHRCIPCVDTSPDANKILAKCYISTFRCKWPLSLACETGGQCPGVGWCVWAAGLGIHQPPASRPNTRNLSWCLVALGRWKEAYLFIYLFISPRCPVISCRSGS